VQSCLCVKLVGRKHKKEVLATITDGLVGAPVVRAVVMLAADPSCVVQRRRREAVTEAVAVSVARTRRRAHAPVTLAQQTVLPVNGLPELVAAYVHHAEPPAPQAAPAATRKRGKARRQEVSSSSDEDLI
jgi:hypothetical protein